MLSLLQNLSARKVPWYDKIFVSETSKLDMNEIEIKALGIN